MKKRIILRLLALIVISSLAFGNIIVSADVQAAKSGTGKVKVSTLDKLESALNKKGSGTIIFSTDKTASLVIEDKPESGNKKLIINAPSSVIENRSAVASVSVKAAKQYTEKGTGLATITGNNVKYIVGEGRNLEKLTITGNNAEIILKDKASVKKLVADKKSGKLAIEPGFLSFCDVTLKKKTALSLSGDSDSNINITIAAAGSSVVTGIPISLLAKKNASVTLNIGSDSSELKTSSKKIKLTVKDNTKNNSNTYTAENTDITDLIKNPPDPVSLKIITASAESKPNTTLNIKEGEKVLKTKEEVRDYIYNTSKNYVGFSVVAESFDLISDPSYYMEIFPALASMEFSEPKIYKNCCRLWCKIKKKISTTDEELFGIDNALSSGYLGYLSKNEKSLYDLIIKIAKELKGKSEYETVKNIHDYLVSSIEYSKNAEGNVYSIRNALVVKKCVCSGYALAFYALCKASGIGVYYISGDAGKNGSEGLHAWNKVRMNGKWYAIDVTWDDPVPDSPGKVTYSYFLITDEDMAYNHYWDDDGLPKADSRDLGIPYQQYADHKRFSTDKEAVKYIKDEIEKLRTNATNGFTFEMEFLSAEGTYLYDELKAILSYYHDNYGCGGAYSSNDRGFLGRLGYIKIYRSY